MDQDLTFVFKRIALGVVVVWSSLTLLFAIFFVMPGDRVDQVMGGERVLSAELRANVRRNLGLDEPLLVQYGKYWANLARGDLGRSYVNGRAVSETLKQTVPASLRLAFWALLVELVVGVGSGAFVVARRGRFTRVLFSGGAALMLAVPVFVFGFVLQLAFGVYPFQHGWPESLQLPVQGMGPDTWMLGVIPVGEQWRYLVLPSVTLGLVSGAVVHRLTRQTVARAMASDYVHAARARGVSERVIMWRHALRYAVVPIMTFVGVDVAALFGSAVVTESVFNWRGVGGELANGLERADAPVVLGLTLVLALAYVFVNVVVDIAHRMLDPRMRSSS